MECASIQRDASSIAWCPISDITSLNIGSNSKCNPLYLLASVHQEMDASFNSSSQIEILNTSPSSINKNKNTVQALGCSTSRQNFTTLAWGQHTTPTEEMPLGLIAGGMEDGCITFWNPYNLLNGRQSRSKISQYSEYHQSKITAMQFNPTVTQHTFLATCDFGQKLYVWDLTNPSKPIAQQPPTGKRSGPVSTYPKYATAVAWNNNVSYILAVSNCLGQTQIYDLRNKKVALTFESKNINRAQSISWNPSKARQLAVCYVKGEAEIWDLKQPKSPKMYLRDETYGHTRSILDLSWSHVDSNLLLTSHEYDNNNECYGNIWNGQNGKLIYQIAFGNEVKSQIEWNNNRGGLLATMSTTNISMYNVNYLGDYCPKWLNKQCGVSLGFGGKIVSYGSEYIVSQGSVSNLRDSGNARTTKRKLKIAPNIKIEYLPKSQAMIARAKQFKNTLNSLSAPKDLKSFTDSKLKSLYALKANLEQKKDKNDTESDKDILSELGISDASDDDDDDDDEEEKKEAPMGNISKTEINFEIKTWEMIQLFFNENNCKDDIIKYLGFEKKELIKQKEEMEQKSGSNNMNINANATAKSPQQTQPNLTVDTNNEIESDNENPFGGDESDSDAEDFFNNLSSKPVIAQKKSVEEDFKIVKKPQLDEKKDDSSTEHKSQPINKSKEQIEKRFGKISTTDNNVRNAIITGNYGLAVDLSLKAGNIADALVFAYYAKDKELWDIVKTSYFTQHSQQFIASTFCHIAENDYLQLVQSSDLMKWKETLAILLTFTHDNEFNELCNLLGHRIMECVDDLQGAIACFLCSNNISLLISIWNMQITDNKKPTDLILNSCITKALIYVNTPYMQKTLSTQKQSYNAGEIALSSIFCRYANLLANQGSLEIAQTFLQFVDEKLKKPQGRHANDPQIKQLMARITQSQQSGVVYVAPPQPKQQQMYAHNNKSRGRGRGRGRDRGRGRGGIRRPSNTQMAAPPIQAKSPNNNTPKRPIRRRGGPAIRGKSQIQRTPQRQAVASPKTQRVAQAANVSSMPNRRGRGRGRGRGGNVMRQPPTHTHTQSSKQHVRGNNMPPTQNRNQNRNQNQNQNQNQIAQQRRTGPPTQHMTTQRQGMNGTTSMPNRNRTNRGRGRGGGGGSVRGRGGAQRMPQQHQQQHQQHQAPPQQHVQQHVQQRQHQPQQAPVQSMPMRNTRGRRGGGRGGHGGRGGRMNTKSPRTQSQSQQQQQPPQPPPQQQMIEERPIGYSAAQTSSGSGFFGQTSILDDDNPSQQLPENAPETLQIIETYLNNISMDENIMNTLSITQSKQFTQQSKKLLKDLDDLILNNKMSYSAYSSLLEIFNSLQSKQYKNATKQTTEFTRSCKSNKSEKFTTHRKWIMAFQSIIHIAKQYNI